MNKYFYYVDEKDLPPIDEFGNFEYVGMIDDFSKSRAEAREIKRGMYFLRNPVIYKFINSPPYKYLEIVS